MLEVSYRIVAEAIEIFATIGQDDLRLRLEILEDLKHPGLYVFRLWRLEAFRIQSTFPQVSGEPSHPPSDEYILKEFEGLSLDQQPQSFASLQAARENGLALVQSWLEGLDT
jgi:hypothetical protein